MGDYGAMQSFKLGDIPPRLAILKKTYALLGIIIFQPPATASVDSYGHYVSAIKINNDFVIYDDLRNDMYNISANKVVGVDALFYVKS